MPDAPLLASAIIQQLTPHHALLQVLHACTQSIVSPIWSAHLHQALAMARPVVGTEVGGLKEVVPDGVAGVIVDPRDDAAIAAALGRMISAPPDPTTCREAALVHSLDVETDRVLEVLATAARR